MNDFVCDLHENGGSFYARLIEFFSYDMINWGTNIFLYFCLFSPKIYFNKNE